MEIDIVERASQLDGNLADPNMPAAVGGYAIGANAGAGGPAEQLSRRMSRLELPYPEQAVWERRFGNFGPGELAVKVEPFTTAGHGEVSPISADIVFGLMGDHGYFPGMAGIRAMSGSRHIVGAPAFDAAHRPAWWDRSRVWRHNPVGFFHLSLSDPCRPISRNLYDMSTLGQKFFCDAAFEEDKIPLFDVKQGTDGWGWELAFGNEKTLELFELCHRGKHYRLQSIVGDKVYYPLDPRGELATCWNNSIEYVIQYPLIKREKPTLTLEMKMAKAERVKHNNMPYLVRRAPLYEMVADRALFLGEDIQTWWGGGSSVLHFDWMAWRPVEVVYKSWLDDAEVFNVNFDMTRGRKEDIEHMLCSSRWTDWAVSMSSLRSSSQFRE